MRPQVLIGSLIVALLCSSGTALAQKTGGVLRMFHRDNPPSASIHEESTASTVVPFMPVFNNLVLFDQAPDAGAGPSAPAVHPLDGGAVAALGACTATAWEIRAGRSAHYRHQH